MVAYTVALRTRELAVRIALGAGRWRVVALAVRWGVVPALAGIGMGLAVGLVGSRVLAGLLYEVSPTDLPTFVLAPALLLAVVVTACLLPARDASRVEPREALTAG